ncbi:MAG: hypothetical protein GY697_21295 [Desulfobacterales bacterium]|nr:hypothetical protein [Desulfobacterales bacterium]
MRTGDISHEGKVIGQVTLGLTSKFYKQSIQQLLVNSLLTTFLISISLTGSRPEKSPSRKANIVFGAWLTRLPMHFSCPKWMAVFIITNNHKGAMSVASSPGKGARFIIQLPIVV